MISSSFLTDSQAIIVVDASVVINLNATTHASKIITALPSQMAITDNAIAELVHGANSGYSDARQLQELIDTGFMQPLSLGKAGIDVYESLIEGSAYRTLDDGEAATIACAYERSGIAMIDERKARRLCSESYPSLQVISTVELLVHESIAHALGPEAQVESIYKALTIARMRVPPEHLALVVNMIGRERAALCNCLPKAARVIGQL